MSRILLAATLALALSLSDPHGAGAADGPRGGARPAAAAGLPTPVPPYTAGAPEGDDTFFVADTNDALGRTCAYRSAGPLRFEIEVDRYVGEVTAEGFLPPETVIVLETFGTLTAKLKIAAYDVDSDDPTVLPPDRVEIDRVLLNGREVGFLQNGQNNSWKTLSLDVPIEHVRFPSRAPLGESPVAAKNQIEIQVDVGNAPAELWCTAVAWGAIQLRALSPVVLVHGNNSDGGFYDRQGFTDTLRAAGVVYDNGISFDPSAAPIGVNAATIDALLPQIVKSFGVDSVHLAVHSKGGLDSREYLVAHHPKHEADFKVLSLSTLSTPHDGSLLADIQVDHAAALAIGQVEFRNFPAFTQTVSRLSGVDGGIFDLTVPRTAELTARHVPALRDASRKSDRMYMTIAADADRNGDGSLQRDEYIALVGESFGLTALDTLDNVTDVLADYAANVPYRILHTTAALGIGIEPSVGLSPGGTPYPTYRIVITRIPAAMPLGNDALVTIPSGLGRGGFDTLTIAATTFQGPNRPAGRNHASIADGGVAAEVFQFIRRVDRENGDLVDDPFL